MVGMGAVVIRNIQPDAIGAGVSAHPIRMRFGVHKVAELLRCQWWKAEYERLTCAAKFIKDPQRFVQEIGP